MPQPRSTYRFRIQEPLKGSFGNLPVSIRDMSEKGLQIEHSEALPKGFSGTLSYSIPGGSREITLHGELRWSQVADDSGWEPLFRSGVAIDQNSEALSSSLDLFIRKGIAKLDRGARVAKSPKPSLYPTNQSADGFVIADRAGAVRPMLVDAELTLDDLRAVEQAREKLASSFDDSLRWYNRARFALAEDSVRDAVIDIRHKEDVLAVWEFLGRTIEISTIAKVFSRRSY